MPTPPGDTTGKARLRTNWRGKLILQVERSEHRDAALGGPRLYWSDATQFDLYRVRYMRDHYKMEPLI